jgi:hypothetical protein
MAPAALAAARSTCANGHPYTAETTLIYSDGARRCRICQRAAMLRLRARLRARRK